MLLHQQVIIKIQQTQYKSQKATAVYSKLKRIWQNKTVFRADKLVARCGKISKSSMKCFRLWCEMSSYNKNKLMSGY